MNNTLNKIASFLLGLVLLAYVGYQGYRFMFSPVKTETAVYYEAYDSVTADVFAVKNETVILSESQKVKVYQVTDGSRIEKNGVIIEEFDSGVDPSAQEKINSMEKDIAALKELNKTGKSFSLHADLLSRQMSEQLMTIAGSVQNNSFDGVNEMARQFVLTLNKYQLGMNRVTDYNALIDKMMQEKDALSGGSGRSTGKITSPIAGFFVSGTDGHEESVKYGEADKTTVEQFDGAVKRAVQPAANAVGKVIGDYDWYLLCKLSAFDATKVKEGSSVSFQLPFLTDEDIPADVVKVNMSGDAGGVAVLKSNYMTEVIANLRIQPAKLLLKKYSGLMIHKKAVRFNDEVKGVYVKLGPEIKFKKIDVLQTEGNYLICATDFKDKSMLQLYDEVVIEGKNLYDGKIIN